MFGLFLVQSLMSAGEPYKIQSLRDKNLQQGESCGGLKIGHSWILNICVLNFRQLKIPGCIGIITSTPLMY